MRTPSDLSKAVLRLSDRSSRTPGATSAADLALLAEVDLETCSPLMATRIRRVLGLGTPTEKTKDAVLQRLARGGLPAPATGKIASVELSPGIVRLSTAYRPKGRTC